MTTAKWNTQIELPTDPQSALEAATKQYVDAGLTTKAPLNNASLTGVPTAPTAAGGTNTTQIATTAFVQQEIAGLTAGGGETASSILTKLLTVDGAGSGLDADLLDGQEGSYYLSMANMSGTWVNPLMSGNATLAGDLLPDANNVRSLGSPTLMWKDLHIGPGSLYLNGQKILEDTTSGTIRMTADLNQNIAIQPQGTGDIELNPLGTGLIQLKGNVMFQGGSQVRTTDGTAFLFDDNITFTAGAGFEGDIGFSGAVKLNKYDGGLVFNAFSGGLFYAVGPDGNTDNVFSLTRAGASSYTLNVYGNLQVNGNSTWHAGNFDPSTKLDVSATAAAATKLATSRNIAIGGVGSGSVAFNGTGDITIPLALDTKHGATISDFAASFDLNIERAIGYHQYFQGSTALNGPAGLGPDSYFFQLGRGNVGWTSVQMVADNLSNWFVRTTNAASFNAWYKLWHSGNFDPSSKANATSATLTGVPTAPTAANGTNTTQIATTAFVQAALASYTPSLPANTVTTDTPQTIEASKTFTGAVNFIGQSGVSTFLLDIQSDVTSDVNGLTFRKKSISGPNGAVRVNDRIAAILGAGWDGTAYYNAVAIDGFAEEAFTGSAGGSSLRFSTTSIGAHTRTQRWKIDAPGHFLPFANNVYDIGSSSLRVRAAYITTLDNPALTGTPTAPTAAGGTNTTQIATTAFVQTALAGVASPSNMVTTNTVQTIDGDKTLTGVTTFIAQDGVSTLIAFGQSDTASQSNNLYFRRKRSAGTGAVTAGDRLGGIMIQGHNGSVYNTPAAIEFYAEEAFTASAGGTFIQFATSAPGTTTRTARWAIVGAGHLLPSTASIYDIGSSTKRVSTLYADAVNINNLTVNNNLTAPLTWDNNLTMIQMAGGGKIVAGSAGYSIIVRPGANDATVAGVLALAVQGYDMAPRLSVPDSLTKAVAIANTSLTIGGSSNVAWHSGNDGAGSTLDADLLDGQEGSYYLSLTNVTGTLADARLPSSLSGKTFTSTTTVDVGGGAASSTAALTVNNGSRSTSFFAWLGSGSYNPLVQAGDHAIIYHDGTSGTGGFFIGPWHTTGYGLRLDASGAATVNGNSIWHAGNFDPTTKVGTTGSWEMSGNLTFIGGVRNALDMGNNSIIGVNALTFSDPGDTEGISWAGGNGWKIVESPDVLGNGAGNLQFITNTTRRATLDVNGVFNALGGLQLNGSDVWHAGNFTATSIPTQDASIGFTSANGRGLKFWNNTAYSIYMSSSGDATYGGRITGETTSDYNMYFKMGGGTNRGFVFMNGSTPVAGIDAAGNCRITGGFEGSTLNVGRIVSGYDSGVANSINCSGWFRTTGTAGLFCASYGSGIHMTDTTYVKTYNNGNKAMMASDFVISSDERLKTGIHDLVYNGPLRPVNFRWKATGKSDIGFIAQEVEKLYPDLVGRTRDDDGGERMILSYPRLTAVLSHQINAAEDEIATLKERNLALEEEIEDLKAKLARIMAQLNLS